MTLAERIKTARLSAGLNQVEMGIKAGVSSSTASRWEQGKRIPRSDEMSKLASVLGVSVDWLINGGDDAPAVNSGIMQTNVNGDNSIHGADAPIRANMLLYAGPDGARVELPNTPENARVFRRMVTALLNSAINCEE